MIHIPTPSEILMSLLGKKTKPFGLAFSGHHLTVVQLEGNGKKEQIRGCAQMKVKDGALKKGVIVDEKHFAQGVRSLVKAAKPKSINHHQFVLSIPDNQCFFQLLLEPKENVNTLLDSLFPCSLDDLVYEIRNMTIHNKSALYIVATKKEPLKNHLHALGGYAGYEPTIVEPAAMSLLRNLDISIKNTDEFVLLYEDAGMLNTVFYVGCLPVENFSVAFPKNEEALKVILDSEFKKTIQYLNDEYGMVFKKYFFLGQKDDLAPLNKTMQEHFKGEVSEVNRFRVSPVNDLGKGMAQWCMASGSAMRGIGHPIYTPVNLLKNKEI
jgi:hypothetical protein